MSQPKWKLVANLGDKDPITYGGFFVYVDETGVYPPEAEILETYDDDESLWRIYRFPLEDCTYACPIKRPSVNVHMTGTLSDNRFHPTLSAWFDGKLLPVARYTGQTIRELIEAFCSDDPCKRAFAWQALGEYYGMANLDEYPIELTSRAEVEARYKDHGI
jgi:hypothetical protein